MDSARFGRVLGAGARGAAKTLLAAADAAASPNPRDSSTPCAPAAGAANSASVPLPRIVTASPPPAEQRRTARPSVASAAPSAGRTTRSGTAGIAEGTRRFRTAVAQPVRRLSGVLWLEFTGVFFGLFAISAALGAWRLLGDPHALAIPGPPRNHFLMGAAIALVFAYFCVSSFLRAGRRSRRA